jgi:leucyl-tRNA synthetase
MAKYDHNKIEYKYKEHWYNINLYKAQDFSEKEKKYILAEFPYPSGKSLHAGHMWRYTLPDVYARYLRMKGYNVLFPMGWDAFGLPAENYAVKTGIHPAKSTDDIIKNLRDSMMKMGFSFDWEREIKTTDPKYYKWTQWIFLKLYKAGLADYKEMPIWWCENLRTVLSDEEVLTLKDGSKVAERDQTSPVERKMFKQWVLKIPEYADKLIDGLNDVDFPDAIKHAQINWIGKSTGAMVTFDVGGKDLEVFTTRSDTLYGVTFMAISPEHPLLEKLLKKVKNKKEIEDYIVKSKNISELERQTNKEKTGIKLEGITVKHPLNDFDLKIPVFVADYVLMDYGTGAVMGVPGHDERDFEFAKKHNLKTIKVVELENKRDLPYPDEGTAVNSGKYDGLSTEEFKTSVVNELKELGKGYEYTNYKIRDWVFSRQRYWGEPIPLLHFDDGSIGMICDPDDSEEVNKNLPLELPEVPDYNPSTDGSSPLEKNKEWLNIKVKNKKTTREANTMQNWAGSCWYFLRYIDPKNDNEFADYKKLEYWLPVDKYFGGAEHTTLHLLYSRFWHKFLYDQKAVPTPEPYAWRMNGGILLGPDGKMMSKSKGNVIEPMDLISKFGADALRTYICFIGPYEGIYPWNDNGIKSTYKLVQNLYEFSELIDINYEPDDETLKKYHKMVKNVTQMLDELKMNTSVSEFMIFANHIKNKEKINKEMFLNYLKLIAPFAPFACEDLWLKLNDKDFNEKNSIHLSRWPEYEEKYTIDETITIPVQINGKVRTDIKIERDTEEEKIKEILKENNRYNDYTNGKEIKKFIFVKNKIVNVVTD